MRNARLALAAAALAALTSCAPAVHEPASLPVPPAPAATPAPARPSPGAVTPGSVAAPSAAAPDTIVSAAGAAVLASIPEPLGDPAAAAGKGARRGPASKPQPATSAPPASAPKPAEPVGIPAPAETYDTLRVAQTAADDPPASGPDADAVPVPAPTRPLGAATSPPAPTPPPVTAPVVTPPPSATPAQPQIPVEEEVAAPAAADTCWRVQVGASSQRAKASRLRAAAESQLLMRMVVERDRNLWKVRTQDCVGRPAAESLKARAIASGFQGVFLVRYVKRP